MGLFKKYIGASRAFRFMLTALGTIVVHAATVAVAIESVADAFEQKRVFAISGETIADAQFAYVVLTAEEPEPDIEKLYVFPLVNGEFEGEVKLFPGVNKIEGLNASLGETEVSMDPYSPSLFAKLEWSAGDIFFWQTQSQYFEGSSDTSVIESMLPGYLLDGLAPGQGYFRGDASVYRHGQRQHYDLHVGKIHALPGRKDFSDFENNVIRRVESEEYGFDYLLNYDEWVVSSPAEGGLYPIYVNYFGTRLNIDYVYATPDMELIVPRYWTRPVPVEVGLRVDDVEVSAPLSFDIARPEIAPDDRIPSTEEYENSQNALHVDGRSVGYAGVLPLHSSEKSAGFYVTQSGERDLLPHGQLIEDRVQPATIYYIEELAYDLPDGAVEVDEDGDGEIDLVRVPLGMAMQFRAFAWLENVHTEGFDRTDEANTHLRTEVFGRYNYFRDDQTDRSIFVVHGDDEDPLPSDTSEYPYLDYLDQIASKQCFDDYKDVGVIDDQGVFVALNPGKLRVMARSHGGALPIEDDIIGGVPGFNNSRAVHLEVVESIFWDNSEHTDFTISAAAADSDFTEGHNQVTLTALTYPQEREVEYVIDEWVPQNPADSEEKPSLLVIDGKVKVRSGSANGRLYIYAYDKILGSRVRTPVCEVNIGCSTCSSDSCLMPVATETDSESMRFWIGDGAGEQFYVPNDTPSAQIVSPSGLKYPYFKRGKDIIYEGDVLRQVKTDKTLFDIITIDAYKYELRAYPLAQVGAKENCLYPVSGEPKAKVVVENPDQDLEYKTVRLSQIEAGSEAIVTELVYSPQNGAWSTRKGVDPDSGEAISEESITQTADHTGLHPLFTVTRDLKNGDGETFVRNSEVFAQFPFGRRIVSSIADPGGADRIVQYSYYEDASYPGSYGKIKSVSYPDGGWERYEYDSEGRESRIITPWLNSKIDDPDDQSVATEYDYSPLGDDLATEELSSRPRTTIVKTLGFETQRRFAIYLAGRTDTIVATSTGATWNDPSNLVSTRYTIESGEFASRTLMSVAPDGTVTRYAYQRIGNAVETTVENGEYDDQQGIVIDGTRSVTFVDSNGQLLSSEAYDIASGILTGSSVATQFDAEGRVTRTDYLDGTFSSRMFGCCGVDYQIDRNGIRTDFLYDALKRLKSTIRLGIETRHEYDAAGRKLKTTQIGRDGGEIVASRLEYNGEGSLAFSYDALDRVTSYATTFLAEGGARSETTYPGGGTVASVSALDGRVLEESGTATAPMAFEYGVELLDGTYATFEKSIKIGDLGERTEWTKSYTDMAGRLVRVEYPDGAYSEIEYDSLGRRSASRDPDGVTVLFAYNNLGQAVVEAVDIDRDGVIDFDGLDRISRRETSVLHSVERGLDILRSTVEVWPESGLDSPVVVQIQEQTLDGLFSWSIDAAGIERRNERSIAVDGDWSVRAYAASGAYSETIVEAGLQTSVAQYDNLGEEVMRVDRVYDEFDRLNSVIDPRIGTTRYVYRADGSVESLIQPAPNPNETELVTSFIYDAAGRQITRTLADGSQVFTRYDSRGQVSKVYGSQTNPVEYDYDSQGRLKTMTTWQDFDVANGVGVSGGATTTWVYSPDRGRLSQKLYEDGNGPSYTYTLGGLMETRTWARGVVTRYNHSDAGQLESVDYSDGTPDIHYAYDRLGRSVEVKDGVLVAGEIALGDLRYRHQFHFMADMKLEREEVEAAHDYQLSRRYEASAAAHPGRYGGYDLGTVAQPSLDASVTYGYDGLGRLESVSAGLDTFTYGYLAQSGMLETVSGPTSVTTYAYESGRNARSSVANRNHADELISLYDYEYDRLGRRVNRVASGSAVAQANASVFAYDEMGQVISETRSQGTDLENPGAVIDPASFLFAYDDIGNRSFAEVGPDAAGGALERKDYQADLLNQYASIDAGGLFNPIYDLDGNLLEDAEWFYYWNGENRLVKLQAKNPSAGDAMLEFSYDYQGRRVEKKVSLWDASSTQFVLDKSSSFSYDQWNPVHEIEYDENGIQLSDKVFTWGLDLSGTAQGAGGVGGLLSQASETVSVGAESKLYPLYDANGNVTEVLDESGAATRTVEYGPFGEIVSQTGISTEEFGFGFSTKLEDVESGLLYYGFRYYNVVDGRWPSRDPIGERGGLNLYRMVGNNPIGAIDLLGLRDPRIREVEDFGSFMGALKDLGFCVIDGIVNRIPEGFSRAGAEQKREALELGLTRDPTAYIKYAVGTGFSMVGGTATAVVHPNRTGEAIGDTIWSTHETLDNVGISGAANYAQVTNLMVGQFIGYTPVLESYYGLDIATGRELSDLEALERGIDGSLQIVLAVGTGCQCSTSSTGRNILHQGYRDFRAFNIRHGREYTDVYRGTSYRSDIAALEAGFLESPAMRLGVENSGSGFMSKIRHSLDSSSPPSPWVSVTSSELVARGFAGNSGYVFVFQVRKNQLVRAWWSPFPQEFESLIRGGTKIKNLEVKK